MNIQFESATKYACEYWFVFVLNTPAMSDSDFAAPLRRESQSCPNGFLMQFRTSRGAVKAVEAAASLQLAASILGLSFCCSS